MAISREEVEKVSVLARLVLAPDELDRMTVELGQILDYVELLSEVATRDVAPMAHAADVTNVFRPDAARECLPREQALANAPHRDDECYLVPAVLGEL